jgi:hypothetical protein
MCTEVKHQFINVSLTVTVCVDPLDDELLDMFDAAKGRFSVVEVVCDEIKSNLESVSYVRKVSVRTNERR